MKRLLTAAVLIPCVLAAVLLAPAQLFAILLLIVALFAVREFYDLAEACQLHPYRWLGFVATAILLLRVALPWAVAMPDTDKLIAGFVLVILVRALSLPERLNQSLSEASITLMGILYPGLMVALLGAIRLNPAGNGRLWLLFLLVTVWVGDSAAYYVGRAWGRHRMAPQVSPKKTWEGAAASLGGAFLAGGLIGWGLPALSSSLTFSTSMPDPATNPGLRFLLAGLLAVVINVAAQVGDLAESVFKRGAHIKDSGTLLPGHGGVLDRIDALLLAAPVLWYYLALHA
jgi:phosphatidate cytidylyltransferase